MQSGSAERRVWSNPSPRRPLSGQRVEQIVAKAEPVAAMDLAEAKHLEVRHAARPGKKVAARPILVELLP